MMLVLTRKVGERIVVAVGGELVTIQLLATASQRARIGIEAPATVHVFRQEIWDRMALAGTVLPDELLTVALPVPG